MSDPVATLPTPIPAALGKRPVLPSLNTPLNHLGVILATGVDAASFLQGQLTQDVQLMDAGESRLAGFCTAKGRLLASFWLHKRADANGAPEFLLVCSRDILTATLKRLSMFVLRAKVKLSDTSGQFQIFGLAGIGINSVASSAHDPRPGGPFSLDNLINLPAVASVPRALRLVPIEVADSASTPQQVAGNARDHAWWLWSEVASGIAMVSQPVVEAFVPQMLNYESTGGVNFKKGCYPGQEVVARSQFRGTLKRRAYLVHSDGPMQAGDEVFSQQDAEQACGTVVQAAAAPDFTSASGFDAVVSMQVAAAEVGGLTLKSATGSSLVLMALPYDLLEDI